MAKSTTYITDLLSLYHGRCLHTAQVSEYSSSDDYLVKVGLGPIAYAARSISDLKTSELLKSADLTAQVLHRQLRKAVGRILVAADQNGIEVVLLKGISIADEFYESSYHRIMADVDLLVASESAQTLQDSLIAMGYKPVDPGLSGEVTPPHHLPELRNEEVGLSVEVHTGIVANLDHSALPLYQPELFWSQTVRSVFDGMHCMRFTATYQFVHTVNHWALNGGWAHNVIGFNDVMVMVNRDENRIDWRQVGLWMHEYPQFAEQLAVLFFYLEGCGLIDVPEILLPEMDAARGRIGAINIRILHWLLRTFPMSGRRKVGWVLSAENALVVWRTMLEIRPKYLRVGTAMSRVIFRRQKGKSIIASISGRLRTLVKPND